MTNKELSELKVGEFVKIIARGPLQKCKHIAYPMLDYAEQEYEITDIGAYCGTPYVVLKGTNNNGTCWSWFPAMLEYPSEGPDKISLNFNDLFGGKI